MSTILQLIGKRATKGDVGVEIEVEGRRLRAVDNAVWRSEDDGSLRGVYPETRCEYIFQQPIPVDAVKVAVKGLLEELKGAEFKFSYRTSVHVHVNVQKLEYDQMLAMMYTYYLLEEPLQTFAGRERKGNNFCLRLADAEGVLNYVLPMFEQGEAGIHNIPRDNARYSAMNIEALNKYGSLEFRGMKGNMDPDTIAAWCRMLVKIRDYAIIKGAPKKVYEAFMLQNPLAFLQEVLGKDAELLMYPRIERDLQTSFSISIDLPFSHKTMVVKPVEEYQVGDVIGYECAVKVQRAGGYVTGLGAERYVVEKAVPKDKEALKKKVIKNPAKFAQMAAHFGGGEVVWGGLNVAPAVPAPIEPNQMQLPQGFVDEFNVDEDARDFFREM